ncbi:hypothetical protein F5H01DRAFT_52775 [Linnemannia elongata]|nr:hypothetical protein F5H01DRAFT_52775 [Linnemannia elongata]
MLYETPPTRLTRSRTKLGFVLGSYLDQTSLSNPQPPVPLPPTASASSSLPALSSPVQFPQLQAASDLANSQQQAQQLQRRKRQKQQKQQNHQIQRKQPKQPARDKTPYDQCLPVSLPSPEPTTKIASPSLSSAVDPNPASDDTADTANNSINNNIAPNTPNITSSSSEQPPSRPVSQERTRGGVSGTLEVDTHSCHYSPSPYRTPTWSPESTSSNQQAGAALTQELLAPKVDENSFNHITPTADAAADADNDDPSLSPLSLLSAVASVVGNRIGSPGLSNLNDLVTCESLRSLSLTTSVLKTVLSTSTTTISQDSALPYVSHEQGLSSSQQPLLLQDLPSPLFSPSNMGTSSASSSKAGSAQPAVSPAVVPRKRGRPPKLNNTITPSLSSDGDRPSKLSAIAPKLSQEGGAHMLPRQRSGTPCSTSSTSSLHHTPPEIRPILLIGDPQNKNGQGQTEAHNKAKPTPVPRLKHNRKPNPDGAIWSVAELAAETSAERRPARAIVFADERLKKVVEENRICIMEPCFRNPVRGDLYCVGRLDGTGKWHEHGDICIHEKRGCHIVLAFRYRYQLRLDVTYLAWVSSIDMATIPVSVLRDFSANREVMRQALEGEERMAEQYRLLSEAGYFAPRKEEKRGQQDNTPSVTLDGWSIAHQNEVLMASKSNRLGFLQWVAQAYQMAKEGTIQSCCHQEGAQ